MKIKTKIENMRKTVIKYLALSYFFRVFGTTIQIPRVVPIAFILMSLGVLGAGVLTDTTDILWFAPFIVLNLILIIYFRVFPVTFKDWGVLDDQQRFLAFQKRPQFSSSKASPEIIQEFYDRIEPEFYEKFGVIKAASHNWVLFILMVLNLLALGMIYMYVGSLSHQS